MCVPVQTLKNISHYLSHLLFYMVLYFTENSTVLTSQYSDLVCLSCYLCELLSLSIQDLMRCHKLNSFFKKAINLYGLSQKQRQNMSTEIWLISKTNLNPNTKCGYIFLYHCGCLGREECETKLLFLIIKLLQAKKKCICEHKK